MDEKKKEDIKKEVKQKILSKLEHPITKIPKTFGQKAADILTKRVGSWGFILFLIFMLIVWIIANLYAWLNTWDPYPFVLLNLVFGALAAIQAPIILMSQNRQAQMDRIRTEYDYTLNRKAEKEIQAIKKQLNRIEIHMMTKRKKD